MKIKTAAKINLALDVIDRLENGYHLIESVFQIVGMYDEITVDLAESGISVSCELPEEFAKADPIPCDERNIAYKAAKLFFETANIAPGCNIHIKKGIPSQAGMGGGSTDAAAVLYCLNTITGEPFIYEDLAVMGKKLGADVPFFFTGGTAYVGGIGEEITPLPEYSDRILVIAKGEQGVSTGEAYARIDALTSPVHPETRKLADALKNSPETAPQFFGNLFEQAVPLPEVGEICGIMEASGAHSPCMTGSGSAVFGLFTDEQQAEKCAGKLREKGFFAQVCRTASDPFIVIE